MIVALEDLELRVWHLDCERLKESRWDDPVVRTGKVALGNAPQASLLIRRIQGTRQG
jgi:hypothetical protein